MRLFRHYQHLPPAARGGVVAIGNFDGVHRGHQAVIGAAAQAARAEGRRLQVLSFEPHPRAFFFPDQVPFRLTPFRIKVRDLAALGVEDALLQHFDAAFAALGAEAFIDQVLVQALGARHVVVGYDYVFGRQRQGTVAMLEDAAHQHRFHLTCVPPAVAPDGAVFSSTRVRTALVEGRVADAAAMLGRWWEIAGHVQAGAQRGRSIGFPTANIALGEHQPPAYGVYAVRVAWDQGDGPPGPWHDGVANLGVRPTVAADAAPLLEVHLFDPPAAEFYGAALRVAFLARVRPEKKFDGLPALQAQIVQDREAARALLAERPMALPPSFSSLSPDGSRS